MNILVTGGAGYIGSHTSIELINAGYEVIIVDNLCNSNFIVVDRIQEITGKKVKFYKIDATNKEELKKVFERYTDCEVVAKSDIGDALTEAYDRRGESEIYCLGSLYLVGAIKERIAGGNNHAELR